MKSSRPRRRRSGSPVARRWTLVPAILGIHSLRPACAPPSGAARVGYAGSGSTGDPTLSVCCVVGFVSSSRSAGSRSTRAPSGHPPCIPEMHRAMGMVGRQDHLHVVKTENLARPNDTRTTPGRVDPLGAGCEESHCRWCVVGGVESRCPPHPKVVVEHFKVFSRVAPPTPQGPHRSAGVVGEHDEGRAEGLREGREGLFEVVDRRVPHVALAFKGQSDVDHDRGSVEGGGRRRRRRENHEPSARALGAAEPGLLRTKAQRLIGVKASAQIMGKASSPMRRKRGCSSSRPTS